MLSDTQIQVIRCAYADLIGARQSYEQGVIESHDWDSHQISIDDLKDNFDFLDDSDIPTPSE